MYKKAPRLQKEEEDIKKKPKRSPKLYFSFNVYEKLKDYASI